MRDLLTSMAVFCSGIAGALALAAFDIYEGRIKMDAYTLATAAVGLPIMWLTFRLCWIWFGLDEQEVVDENKKDEEGFDDAN